MLVSSCRGLTRLPDGQGISCIIIRPFLDEIAGQVCKDGAKGVRLKRDLFELKDIIM